jgi:hypothetical protein
LHSIVTISTSFKQAWKDMLAHRISVPPEDLSLPRPEVGASTKPI